MNNKQKHKVQRKRDDRSRQALEAVRIKAVKRVLEGESPISVVCELGFHHSCIYRWLDIYKKKGEAGLGTRKITGRPSKRNTASRPIKDKGSTSDHTNIPRSSNIAQWALLLNKSLIDSEEHPLNSFISILGRYFKGGVFIAPDLHAASSPLRSSLGNSDLHSLIELNKLMTDTWHANPFLHSLRNPGDIQLLDEIIPRKQWKKNDFCHLLLQRSGVEYVHMMGLCIEGPKQTTGGLFVYRMPDQEDFKVSDKKFLMKLRPHIETAMMIMINSWRSTYTAKTLGEATSSLDVAVLILDGSGRVIETTSAAEDILDQKQHIKLTGQRLDFFSSDKQKKFDQAVNNAIIWRRELSGPKPLDVMRFSDTGGSAIGVLVQAITPPSMTIPHSVVVAPHVIVYINDLAKPRPALEHQLIVRLFNLSTREALLTTLLTDGHTLNEAAKIMGITQATARTYLQHVYEKVGVNRQQDLVQRVMKSVAVLV